MPEEEGKNKKDEDRIVLRVDMDCEGCRQKVRRALRSIPGLEKVEFDMKEQTVTVKGKADAFTVYETVKRKSGKRTVLLYPESKKEDAIMDSITKIVDSITELLNPKPPDSTVVLKVQMHCAGCAKRVSKSLYKLEGVTNVSVDIGNDTVTVKGRSLDAEKVCDWVRDRCGKHCQIVPPSKSTEKKDEKKGEKTAKEEKVAEGKKEGATEKKKEVKDQEKKEDKKPTEKTEEVAEIKKYDSHTPAYSYTSHVPEEYNAYAPQLFSDENPNACSIM